MRTAVVAIAVGAVLAVAPTPAAGVGAFSCDVDAERHALRVDSKGDATIILVRGSAGQILVGGRDCGATMTSVDRVRVTGDAGNQTLVQDLRGGPFGPGLRDEASRENEVEVTFDAGDGRDSVTVVGTDQLDLIGGSATSWKVNPDSDVDGWGSGIDAATFLGMDGADYLFAMSTQTRAILFDGGPGNDVLRGLGGPDRLHGGAGQDVLTGRGGNDRLFPGGDADYVRGNTGGDHLHLADGSLEVDIACGRGEDTIVDADPDDRSVARDCEHWPA